MFLLSPLSRGKSSGPARSNLAVGRTPPKELVMANGDRRRSNKMRRRKGQAKKKERIKRRIAAARKPAAKKK